MRLAIVQMQPRKGDVAANVAMLRTTFAEMLSTAEPAPELVVLPEAALTGYFLEGAVYDCSFSAEAFAALLAGAWRDAGARGPVDIASGFYENAGGTFYNAALYATLQADGTAAIAHVHRKLFLPTYGVFDEERFLTRGRRVQAFDTRFGRAAILICEDMWHAIVPTIAALKGARFIIVPSASPGRGIGGSGELESTAYWRALLSLTASEHGVYVIYAGLTGFEGGKGLAGASSVVGPRGTTLVEAPAIGTCIVRIEIDLAEIDLARAVLPLLGDLAGVLPDLLLDDELPLPVSLRTHG
jgi:predicted amidohydrolase